MGGGCRQRRRVGRRLGVGVRRLAWVGMVGVARKEQVQVHTVGERGCTRMGVGQVCMELGRKELGCRLMGLVHMVVVVVGGHGVGHWRQQLPLEQREPRK